MTTYYVNPATGNDAADGLTWGTAWRTLLNGATFERMGQTDSDEIRIAKSPDPVSIGNVTWTDNSSTVTYPSLSNIAIDNAKTGWVQTAGTLSYNSSFARTTGAALQIAMSAVNGKSAHKNLGTTLNLSSMTRLSFWVNFGTTINYSAGTPIQIDLCSDTAGDVAVVRCTLPRYVYPTNHWVPIVVEADAGFDFANATSIQSITIRTSATVTNTIRFDNFFCAGPASSSTSLVLTDLIAKSTEPNAYFPITNIVGTTINIVGAHANTQAFVTGTNVDFTSVLGTETVATFKRSCFVTAVDVPATASTSAILALNYSNSDQGGAFVTKTYIGGVNPATDVVDGETWFDGVTGWGGGLQQTNAFLANFDVSNLAAGRYDRGMWINYPDNSTISNISLFGNTTRAYEVAASNFIYSRRSAGHFTLGVKWLHHGSIQGVAPLINAVQPWGVNPKSNLTLNVTDCWYALNNVPFTFSNTVDTNIVFNSTGTLRKTTSAFSGNAMFAITPLNTGSLVINLNNITCGAKTSGSDWFHGGVVAGVFGGPCTFNFAGFVAAQQILANDSNTSAAAVVFCNFVGSAEHRAPNNTARSVARGAGMFYVDRYFYAATTALPGGATSNWRRHCIVSYTNYQRTVGDNRIVSYADATQPQIVWLPDTTIVPAGSTSSWRYDIPVPTSPENTNPAPTMFRFGQVVVKGGEPVTVSVQVNRTAQGTNPHTIYLTGRQTNTGQVMISSDLSTNLNQWQTLSFTYTPSMNGVVEISLAFAPTATSTSAIQTGYFSDLQITQGA